MLIYFDYQYIGHPYLDNNWELGLSKTFPIIGSDALAPCNNFYPIDEDSLLFNFKVDCNNLFNNDDLKLVYVALSFGDTRYKWKFRFKSNIVQFYLNLNLNLILK